MPSSPHFTALALTAATMLATPALAATQAGPNCPLPQVQPVPGTNIPGNLPGLAYTLPALVTLKDAELQLFDGSGNPVPFIIEGVGPRFVLRLGGTVGVGILRLAHTIPCGPSLLRQADTWAVNPAAPFPTSLGTLELSHPRPGEGQAHLLMNLRAREETLPFLGAALLTATARRAGTVVAQQTNRTTSGPDRLEEIAIPCASAADSGDVEIELRAVLAGTSEAVSAGLVARSTVRLSCPLLATPDPDGGIPVADREAGVSQAPRDPGEPPPTMPPADASADAAPASAASGCTMAPGGTVPWWGALAALAGLLRIRRARS
jgi:hypothetical protein